jgi:hypothetical protein
MLGSRFARFEEKTSTCSVGNKRNLPNLERFAQTHRVFVAKFVGGKHIHRQNCRQWPQPHTCPQPLPLHQLLLPQQCLLAL